MIPAWKLPPIIAAIAVAIVGGFYLGGPGLGMAVGALAASSIVALAVRNPPRGPIWPAPLRDFRRHLLIVVEAPLEDPKAIARIAGIARLGEPRPDEPEIRVLALARPGLLDRWTSDRGRTHRLAGQTLILSLASLTKAGIAAAAATGDEDAVQAVEDELREFPATDVVLVTPVRGGGIDDAAAAELESRLECDFWRVSAGRPESTGRPDQRDRSPAWQVAAIAGLMGIPPWSVGSFGANRRSIESSARRRHGSTRALP